MASRFKSKGSSFSSWATSTRASVRIRSGPSKRSWSNLVSKYDKNPYSYNFFASFAFPWVGRGLIDHALATDAMADQVTKTKVWHVNADEPRLPDSDAWKDSDSRVIPYEARYFTPDQFRASDHDPVVIGLDPGDGDGDGHDDGHGKDKKKDKHKPSSGTRVGVLPGGRTPTSSSRASGEAVHPEAVMVDRELTDRIETG